MNRDPFLGTEYRALSVLASGTHGTLWRAEHKLLGQQVAIKLLNPAREGAEHMAERLQREARALARLRHPHIVTVQDLGRTSDGRVFFVMELLEGRTLQAEIAASGSLGLADAQAWMAQVLGALGLVHAEAMIHRDLKPANVFVTDGPPRGIKLLDLGVMKVHYDPTGQAVGHQLGPLAIPTATGAVVGTPRFMAPEQVRAQAIDHRADVYAAGLLLYEMVAGCGPFDAHKKNLSALLVAQVREAPKPPSAYAPHPIPPALDAVVMRAIEKRPDARFQSAREFADALAAVALSGAPPRSAPPERARPPAPMTPGGTIVMRAHDPTTVPLQQGTVRMPVVPPPEEDPQR